MEPNKAACVIGYSRRDVWHIGVQSGQAKDCRVGEKSEGIVPTDWECSFGSGSAQTDGDFAGPTIWLTGLPCSGKSTLACRLAGELQDRGQSVEVFDGDELRATLCRGLTYSRADRHENALRIGWVCGRMNRHGIVAIVAAVSPYRETRESIRASLPGYVEVYVKAPLAVCRERDVKGLYARAARGEIRGFTGIDDPYEEPLAPEVVVETDKSSIDECTHSILSGIEKAARWAPVLSSLG